MILMLFAALVCVLGSVTGQMTYYNRMSGPVNRISYPMFYNPRGLDYQRMMDRFNHMLKTSTGSHLVPFDRCHNHQKWEKQQKTLTADQGEAILLQCSSRAVQKPGDKVDQHIRLYFTTEYCSLRNTQMLRSMMRVKVPPMMVKLPMATEKLAMIVLQLLIVIEKLPMIMKLPMMILQLLIATVKIPLKRTTNQMGSITLCLKLV